MEYSREWHVSWHTSKIWHQAKYSISICTLSKALSGANQTKGDNINSALFHINMKLKSVQRDNEVRVEPWSKSRQCIIHALPLLLCKKGSWYTMDAFSQHVHSVWKKIPEKCLISDYGEGKPLSHLPFKTMTFSTLKKQLNPLFCSVLKNGLCHIPFSKYVKAL